MVPMRPLLFSLMKIVDYNLLLLLVPARGVEPPTY
jgi:hypothetical protein